MADPLLRLLRPRPLGRSWPHPGEDSSGRSNKLGQPVANVEVRFSHIHWIRLTNHSLKPVPPPQPVPLATHPAGCRPPLPVLRSWPQPRLVRISGPRPSAFAAGRQQFHPGPQTSSQSYRDNRAQLHSNSHPSPAQPRLIRIGPRRPPPRQLRRPTHHKRPQAAAAPSQSRSASRQPRPTTRRPPCQTKLPSRAVAARPRSGQPRAGPGGCGSGRRRRCLAGPR